MVQASLAQHPKKSGQRFLEHEILASAELQARWALPSGWSARAPRIFGRDLADILAKATGQFVVTKGPRSGQVVSFDQLASAWRGQFALAEGGQLFPWPAAHLLASALASGQWWG